MIHGRRHLPFLLGAVSLAVALVPCAAEDPDVMDPFKVLDLGVNATVDVRLVTVDVVVLDRDDRTVAGLGKDDFVLRIDGREAPIEVFDVDCAAGGADEPAALRRDESGAPASDGLTRRVVLAIDYYHLDKAPRQFVFDNLRDLIARRLTSDDEIMLVALANGVRVEQPFTTDRQAVLASLQRMEHDISLWNGNFFHATERPTFEALGMIAEVLSQYPGPKALVLFSDGNWPPSSGRVAGFDYDREFARLAAMAGNARVTLYPVVASGLAFKPSDF